jgi:N-sulfoglucosamine sulfohydrolase
MAIRAVLGSCLLLLASTPVAVARDKPLNNVVVIVADDLGTQLGCYGDRVARTPHIDRLATEGTRFDLAFCTTASCSPSRSVILSGLYNHANGQYGLAHGEHHFVTRPFVKSLPALLRDAGYRTASIGKIHVLPDELYRFDKTLNDGIVAGGRNTVRMAENAEEFLRERDARPFFLYFCPTDPHRAATGFANETEYPGVTPVKFDPAEVPVPHYLPDRPEVRLELAEYYQSVARVDQGVGRLMAALERTGHANDTTVFFLSDNGPPFPGAKTNLYDAGTRLPLIVRHPAGRAKGGVSKSLVNWADLTPTILELTGAKPPGYKLHGRSLLPLLDEPLADGWDTTFGSHTFHEVTMYYPMRSIRTRTHRYILNLAHPLPYPFASDLFESPTWQGVLKRGDGQLGSRAVAAYLHRPREELYDLENDPREVVNLADRAEESERLAQMRGRLRAWQTETADPWVIKYQHE